jgi:short-subunit dehydrogenase
MSSSRFADQTILITGATSGIGRALARALTQEGATVIGTGRDQARLMELDGDVDLALTMDVTDPSSVEIAAATVHDRCGRIDVLINNAGVGLFSSVMETSEEELSRILEVNVVGVSRVTRAFLPAMLEGSRADRRGAIVNIASVAGRRGYPKHTAYCASKHALIGWSRSLRKDMRGTNVDVVVICPPAVQTPFFENAGYMTFDEDHPGLKLMTADEVAAGTLDALASRTFETVLGTKAQALDLLDRFAPSAVDRLQIWKDKRWANQKTKG